MGKQGSWGEQRGMRRKLLVSRALVFKHRDVRKNWYLVENTAGNLNKWVNRSRPALQSDSISACGSIRTELNFMP